MRTRYACLLICYFLTVWNLPAKEPADRFEVLNITHSGNYFEFKPKFVLEGTALAFLVFAGNPVEPGLSDYQLCVTDLEGKALIYKSDAGVIDYAVRPGGKQLDIILDGRSGKRGSEAVDNFDFSEWEIWRLDISAKKLYFLESASGEPLQKAYMKLNIPMDRTSPKGSYKVSSPNQIHGVVIKLEQHADGYGWGFYSNAKKILSSEAWLSYTDTEWVPPILWISKDTFLTVGFASEKSAGFPQSKGIFSIVRVDLSQNLLSILYKLPSPVPIAKMHYNDNSDELFFQAQPHGLGKVLYRLNLYERNAEILYETAGDLGSVDIDQSGSRLVFVDFNDQDSDVIRLDLKTKSIRLAVR